MKAGSSSLNPYAAAYIPLFKREAANVKQESSPGQELTSKNEVVWYGHQQGPHQTQSYYGHNASIQTGEVSGQKDQHGHGGEFLASTSQYPNAFDEDFDRELDFLRTNFPGLSDESLSDVYLANRCDLASTVDMLNQLEFYDDDSSDKLPDTLDIGDVPETLSVGETSSQKVKNPTAGTEASTSASTNVSSWS